MEYKSTRRCIHHPMLFERRTIADACYLKICNYDSSIDVPNSTKKCSGYITQGRREGGTGGGKLPRAPNSKGSPKLEGFSMGWF